MEGEEDPELLAKACFDKTLAAAPNITAAAANDTWVRMATCHSKERKDVFAMARAATPMHEYAPWILIDGKQLPLEDVDSF